MPFRSIAAPAHAIRLDARALTSARVSAWSFAAKALLFTTLLAAPLAFGAVQAWAWASLGILTLVALIFWAIDSMQHRVLRIWWSWLYLPGALFLLLGGIQYFGRLTVDPLGTRESLLKLSIDLVLFFVATQLFMNQAEESLLRFGFIVTVYAFAMGLFAILQYGSSNGRIFWTVEPNGWTFGSYVNHNHYAGLMELLIPVAAGHLLSRREHDPARMFLGFAVLVPIASLLLSGSRGGLVSLFAELLILGGVLLVRFRRQGRLGLATILALGTVGAGLFLWLDGGQITAHLATVFQVPRSPEATVGDRIVMARDSLRILRDHPWVGIGLGSFEDAYPRYQSFSSDFVVNHAHNDYVEALVETGAVGGTFILLALAIFFRRAFANLHERLQLRVGWVQLGAALGCCGLLVHSLADFNFHIPANAAWFCASLAVALSGRVPDATLRS